MQRVATRARALGLLAVYALVQSTTQPDLLIIVRHLAAQVARFWCSFSLLPAGSGRRAGCIDLLRRVQGSISGRRKLRSKDNSIWPTKDRVLAGTGVND